MLPIPEYAVVFIIDNRKELRIQTVQSGQSRIQILVCRKQISELPVRSAVIYEETAVCNDLNHIQAVQQPFAVYPGTD